MQITVLSAEDVVNNLTSNIEVSSDEDQTTEVLNVIRDVLGNVTNLITSGNFSATEDVRQQ